MSAYRKKRKSINGEKVYPYLALAIIAIGVLCRLVLLGVYPSGLNQDEAFAGYNAYSLMKYGVDSSGYANPVYLVAWGSGMNALESYLMIPFIAIFGLTPFAIRLPQAIASCFSLVVIYLLVKKYSDGKKALIACAILSLCPWNILLSRWGLESNLAPAFILFGTYFFLSGFEKRSHLLLSALFYGLSLYAYATVWTYLPFLILFEVIYALIFKKLKFDLWLILFAVLLFLLALPLMLFLLVNMGYMEEIVTPVFSIPKLLYFRGNEVDQSNFAENFLSVTSILFKGSDGLKWNSAGKYGLFYGFSAVFAVIGILYEIAMTVKGFVKKEYRFETNILVAFMLAVLCSSMLSPNINRMNIVFIPFILLTAGGIWHICDVFARESVIPVAIVLAVYVTLFGFFTGYYYTDYNESLKSDFAYGVGDSIKRATELDKDKLILSEDIYYPTALFFLKTPVNDFLDTVEYTNYPAAFLTVRAFKGVSFSNSFSVLDKSAAYVVHVYYKEQFLSKDFSVEEYGNYIVAYYSKG